MLLMTDVVAMVGGRRQQRSNERDAEESWMESNWPSSSKVKISTKYTNTIPIISFFFNFLALPTIKNPEPGKVLF